LSDRSQLRHHPLCNHCCCCRDCFVDGLKSVLFARPEKGQLHYTARVSVSAQAAVFKLVTKCQKVQNISTRSSLAGMSRILSHDVRIRSLMDSSGNSDNNISLNVEIFIKMHHLKFTDF